MSEMELKPHEQRVINELVELQDRTEKLMAFTDGKIFSTLSNNTQQLLLAQSGLMVSYIAILKARIAEFAPQLLKF